MFFNAILAISSIAIVDCVLLLGMHEAYENKLLDIGF